MEEDIEDLIGEIKYTDSQNSNLYSFDFTDSGSDRHNSSGKETYVLACDSDDSDTTYDIGRSISAINLFDTFPKPRHDAIIQCETKKLNKAASTIHTISLIEETFTQTSRTILELADTERSKNSLETQTSLLSISENKKVEYTIQYCGDAKFAQHEFLKDFEKMRRGKEVEFDNEERTTEFGLKEIENGEPNNDNSETSANYFIKIVDSNEDQSIDKDIFGNSQKTDSDFEADSLMDYDLGSKESPKDYTSEVSEISKSIDNEVEELYKKLSQTIEVQTVDRPDDLVLKRCGTLTPLTEESTVKKESLIDITPNIAALGKPVNCKPNEILAKFIGNYVQINTNEEPKETSTEDKGFKLPPIQKQLSCPNSPHLNLLFTTNASNLLTKSETLPCLFEEKPKTYENWFLDKMDHAAGENSTFARQKNNPTSLIQLPPIEGEMKSTMSRMMTTKHEPTPEDINEKISINGRIRELNSNPGKAKGPWTRFRSYPRSPSRSCSPDSSASPTTDAAERGCDSLCGDLLRRLRSSNWLEVADTLDDVPRSLDKFWGVITEQRTADLIRQVSVHVESPRTQVARAACNTLGAVLNSTNYTKKPEFYEAVSLLLVKTGSFNRAVRRAANVALDSVVCGVDFGRAVAALCVHGVGHKSSLVRCAAARLLVVCTAIAGGGRELLRARPASAASARRLALRAMAAMLEDKNTDVRKFAERLYKMLRPLPGFEAFFLSDVDVELAARQIKKFDLLLTRIPFSAGSFDINNRKTIPYAGCSCERYNLCKLAIKTGSCKKVDDLNGTYCWRIINHGYAWWNA